MRHLWIPLLLIGSSASAQCTVTDDLGHQITLTQPAKRIISLAPDITENLFAIGAGTQLVGAISGSDYPSAAKKITRVGSYSGVDLEKILSLKPDLIVTWSSTFVPRVVTPVYVVQPIYLEDVARSLKNLGCLTGHSAQGFKAATEFNQQIHGLREKYQSKKKVKVYFQIGTYSLMTINKKSWINQALVLCGGINPFAQERVITPVIGTEALIAADPDLILSDSPKIDMSRFPYLTAVKDHRVYSVEADWIDRASPRLVKGVTRICQLIAQTRVRM